MELNVTISIDDLHPEKGWGCEGDESVGYLKELNKELGCKFNLFIPSNYHNQYPISEHKDWIDFWLDKDWIELSAHGHYHMCNDKEKFGECEFFEINTQEEANNRIKQCLSEWSMVGYVPNGWRNPGWLAHPESIKIIDKSFEYVALHNEHNHQVQWDSKMFFGHDGINETDSIDIWNTDTFMFQSHIAGDWNDNCWVEENYLNFQNILHYLSTQYNLSYKTIKEL